MGFLRKLNPFDRDDDKKEEHHQEQSSEGTEASSDSGSTSADVSGMAAATAEAAADSATAVAEPVVEVAEVVVAETTSDGGAVVTEVAAASVSTEGTVSGGGLFRTYTTKAGDSLEEIAAYFYGDAVQKQRLLDDNPFLSSYGDTALPGGIQIHVGEDAARGDAIPGQEAAASESGSGETSPA